MVLRTGRILTLHPSRVVLGILGDSYALSSTINHLQAARIPTNSQGFLGILPSEAHNVTSRRRRNFRNSPAARVLSVNERVIEADRLDNLARKHGLQRGEFIRQLILDELARDSGDPPVSVELVEILGLRLMLTNLLKPLATGQKITPEVFDGVIAEVKKHKRSLAIKTRTDLEKA